MRDVVGQATALKRREIIDALRIGAVPRRGLELFAAGLERFERPLKEELDAVAAGRGKFKAVRGEYGTGKTFFARWLEHLALEKSFATTLVQISETETPLYKLETVYRRAVESLQTREWTQGAFRSLVDRWFFNLEEEVMSSGVVSANNPMKVAKAVGDLLERRLESVSQTQPQFAAALMGQPNVGASIKLAASIKGELDNDGAAGFIRGLLEVLKQTGRRGLVLVLDEVETIQRVRADSRERSLNALRQLIDDLVGERFPGLYVLITGTPQFFDGPQGVQRLAPLAQRLQTDFADDPRFDSSRAPQIRLQPFDLERMVAVGRRIRELYPSEVPDRLTSTVDDEMLGTLANAVSGQLGGKVGIAPRIFLKRLVNLLDMVDEHEEFDPRKDFRLTAAMADLTAEEQAAAGMPSSVDDISLDIPSKPSGSGLS